MMLVLPMFAMVLLTFVIGSIALVVRMRSVKSGQVRARSFKLMDAASWPDAVQKTTRNLNNQFEVPVLFYLACTLLLVEGSAPVWSAILAWLFVLARAVHSWIHLTYNHVLHRMLAFWVSCMLVLALWVSVLVVFASA